MKHYTLSNKSWHFWLSNVGVRRVWPEDDLDICTYIRYVIAGTLALIATTVLLLAVAIFFLYGYVTGAIWFYECITTGVWGFPNPIAFMTFCSTLILGLTAAYFELTRKIEAWSNDYRHPEIQKNPSFIKLAYNKFKSKTCVRITIK